MIPRGLRGGKRHLEIAEGFLGKVGGWSLKTFAQHRRMRPANRRAVVFSLNL